MLFVPILSFAPSRIMDLDKKHQNIRLFRESKGFSQTSIADELGIGRSTYINFETGKTRLYCKTLEKLAEHFGVSMESIIQGEEDEDMLHEVELSHREEKAAIIREYEDRLAELGEKLEAAYKTITAHERMIKTLSDTNDFLLSQLRKND